MPGSVVTPVEQRKAWARALIRQAPDGPAYGTVEWLALPDGPEKVAGAVRAAECWATDGDTLEERLRTELEVMAITTKADDDAKYVARRDAHRAEWGSRDYRPHPANVRRRGHLSVVRGGGAA